MPNVITVGSSPAPQIIGHFLDQFNANQRADQQNALGQAELAQRAKAHQDDFSIQSGQLADMQNRFKLIEAEYKDKKETADAQPYIARLDSIHDAKQSLATDDPQQAALDAQAKSLMDDLQQNHPELLPPVKIHYLAPILTPERQTTLNTNKFSAQQTGAAASGSTDPNAVNFTTKKATGSFMPAEGFTQQQATDLARRDAAPDSAGTPTPDLSKKIPTPSGNAVSDFEARATKAMPTSPESLTSQTSITETGMQGQAQRDVAGINARSAMALQKEKEATPAVAASVVQGVITDPQSYFSLPTEDKKIVLKSLGRAPSKISATETERLNAAAFGSQLIDDADQIVKKWQASGTPITGPFLGRFNSAQGTWGELVIPPNLAPDKQQEYAQDVSKLREWLTALPIMESKALAGGRTAYQVIEAVTAAAPSMSKGRDMFEGSVQGLRQRFGQIQDHLTAKQWGGKPPQGGAPITDNSNPLGLTPPGARP